MHNICCRQAHTLLWTVTWLWTSKVHAHLHQMSCRVQRCQPGEEEGVLSHGLLHMWGVQFALQQSARSTLAASCRAAVPLELSSSSKHSSRRCRWPAHLAPGSDCLLPPSAGDCQREWAACTGEPCERCHQHLPGHLRRHPGGDPREACWHCIPLAASSTGLPGVPGSAPNQAVWMMHTPPCRQLPVCPHQITAWQTLCSAGCSGKGIPLVPAGCSPRCAGPESGCMSCFQATAFPSAHAALFCHPSHSHVSRLQVRPRRQGPPNQLAVCHPVPCI